MISRIFLITAIVFLSEYSFCQDSTGDTNHNKASSESETIKTPVVDTPKTTDKKDSNHTSNGNKTEKGKKADNKVATKKNKADKETPAKKSKASPTTEHKNNKDKKTNEKDTAKDELLVTENPIITDTATNQNKDTNSVKRKDSANITKQPVAIPPPSKPPALLILSVIILVLTTAFLFYYNRKITIKNNLLQTTISSYSGSTSSLKKFMVKKGLLDSNSNFEIKNMSTKIEELIDKYISENARIKQLNTDIQNLNNQLRESASASNPSTTFIPYIFNPPSSYIKSEIIVSAGPRKDTASNDTELGEDIAGSISLPGQTFFWVLDGTSDSAVIKGLDVKADDIHHEEYHVFSSRVLAQNVGYFIQQNINAYVTKKIFLNELLTDASNHVLAEFEKRLNNEPAEKKESILQAIRKGFKPICSTTVILGCLLDNGHLYALRTGDSKIFPFKKSNNQLVLAKNFKFSSDPTDEYDRIAFRLDFDEAANIFVIKQNIPKWLTQSVEDIDYVFAFTDGIGRVTEAQLASNNPGIVEMIRQNIARIPQKTHDDKTLVILERIKTAIE